ncbi:MAG: hypothetical protein ACLTDS_01145 [Bianqueaceae bacterium]
MAPTSSGTNSGGTSGKLTATLHLRRNLLGRDDFTVSCEGVAKEELDFMACTGLFFHGILLGVVFIFAAVLIMYYKQVSEDTRTSPGLGSCRRLG